MIKATLAYLIRETTGEKELLLAEKKYGKAKGIWNGIGGKFDHELDNSIVDTLHRETHEEVGVNIQQFQQVGLLKYYDLDEPGELHHEIYVYKVREWENPIQETAEMRPQWFKVNEVPYDQLWPVDKLWLPFLLQDGNLEATFKYRDGEDLPRVINLNFDRV